MKNITIIKCILIVISTTLLAFVIPRLVKMSVESAIRYNFTYYSPVLNRFCFIDMDNDLARVDVMGNVYTEEQFDSILPLFSYRQLITDGRMPDSINGQEINIEKIRKGAFYFRTKPSHVFRPEAGLYPMYESMSGRVKLEVPDDFFRCKKTLEFIDVASNTVNQQKSELFHQALLKKGFVFPAKWVSGIPSARKAYDEGYFICDKDNQLFHLKQINGKPFVKDTQAGKQLNPQFFKMVEAPDRRFYGFLFDDKKQMYQLSTDNYALKQLPFKYDYTTQQMMIMANMLYWNINIISEAGKHTYAVNATTLECVDEYFQKAKPGVWNSVSEWLFPFSIEVEHSYTTYVYPLLKAGNAKSLTLSTVLLMLWIVFINQRKKINLPLIVVIPFILLTGMFGFISLWVYWK